MSELAAPQYPWLPEAVLRYPLRSDEAVANVRRPLLLVHGDPDALIPLAHGESLARKAPSARLVLIPATGHSDVHNFASSADAGRGAGPTVSVADDSRRCCRPSVR